MKAAQVTSVLALVTQALGHGYVYRITSDNTVYPGYDIFVDPELDTPPARIAYGGGVTGPIYDGNSADMACHTVHNPPPGSIAQARAGSKVTFHWSRWLYSHKGPLTAWMAPYDGAVADVKVNELEFFKFAEEAADDDGVWGTVKMLDDTNGTWTVTIPADIKPGTYIIRQEIIALHFALAVPPGFFASFTPVGPQFYMTCFNFNITGDGNATPQGFKFPGAYDMADPALNWDINSTAPYPMAGPSRYISAYDVDLEPKEVVKVSPTGNEARDVDYYAAQDAALATQAQVTEYFDSIGG